MIRRIALSCVLAGGLAAGAVALAEEKSPESLFLQLDKNNDGQLTASEVPEGQQRFFQHLLRVTGNEDRGSLSQADFVRGLKDRPETGAAGPAAGDNERPGPERRGKKKQTPAEPSTDSSRPAGSAAEKSPQGRPGNPKVMFERLDRNGDGKLTAEEVPPGMKDRFNEALRRAGDNKTSLTLEEFEKIAPRPQEGGGENPRALLKRLDANNDGQITRDEVPEPMRERFQEMLRRSGKSAEGSISLSDLRQMGAEARTKQGAEGSAARPEGLGDGGGPKGGGSFGRMPNPAGDGAGPNPGPGAGGPGQMFQKLDANGDGKIEIDEVPAGARPRFEEMLRRLGKKDGSSLTREEFRRAAEQMRGAPGSDGASPKRPRPKDAGGESGSPGQRPAGRDNAAAPGGRMFDLLDANGDGRLTANEVPDERRARFEQRLKELGKDSLTREEFGRIVQQAGAGNE